MSTGIVAFGTLAPCVDGKILCSSDYTGKRPFTSKELVFMIIRCTGLKDTGHTQLAERMDDKAF